MHGYRPDRLARAWQLVKSGRVERLGGSQFRVAGNTEPEYFVDLDAEQQCYCLDSFYRQRENKGFCKHVGAARLASLDPSLLQVIADNIERQMQQEREAATRRRRRRTTTQETEA